MLDIIKKINKYDIWNTSNNTKDGALFIIIKNNAYSKNGTTLVAPIHVNHRSSNDNISIMINDRKHWIEVNNIRSISTSQLVKYEYSLTNLNIVKDIEKELIKILLNPDTVESMRSNDNNNVDISNILSQYGYQSPHFPVSQPIRIPNSELFNKVNTTIEDESKVDEIKPINTKKVSTNTILSHEPDWGVSQMRKFLIDSKSIKKEILISKYKFDNYKQMLKVKKNICSFLHLKFEDYRYAPKRAALNKKEILI